MFLVKYVYVLLNVPKNKERGDDFVRTHVNNLSGNCFSTEVYCEQDLD
jgi:hypothetical protein